MRLAESLCRTLDEEGRAKSLRNLVEMRTLLASVEAATDDDDAKRVGQLTELRAYINQHSQGFRSLEKTRYVDELVAKATSFYELSVDGVINKRRQAVEDVLQAVSDDVAVISMWLDDVQSERSWSRHVELSGPVWDKANTTEG